MKTLKLEGYNKFISSCYVWDNVDNPKGVVQIIHGMQEHAKRYSDMAKYLNSQGFIVFASDLRGHGQTALINNMPFGYSNGDLFWEVVQDQIIFTDYLIKKYKLPISIFGHSFGSFVAQRYMVENGFKIKNIILCGSTYTNNLQFKAGRLLASTLKLFGMKKKKATLFENIGIKAYGKKFPNGNWLTRDDSVWYKYATDELSGNPFPINFYWSMFRNGTRNYKNLKNIPFYLPILLISGTEDPVCGKNGLFKLFVTYGKANKKVFLKSYLGARHELVNETCKEEVLKDISTFFEKDKLDYIPISIS
ncbi:MAG: alpha/beta hydrolase [Clostridiales bacterium]|nr:alpha/beta hydrolase [Clostridiales bacterium]